MSGIGERLAPIPPLPVLPAVLVNPGVAVSTPAVFAALASRQNAPMPDVPSHLSGPADVAAWLETLRNDLEPPACRLVADVQQVLEALAVQSGCLLARMSGSGATCFSLFPTPEMAHEAAAELTRRHPTWWIVPTLLS